MAKATRNSKQTIEKNKPTAPVIKEEISKYDEEVAKRIVPSQPEGGEPEPETTTVVVTEDILKLNPEMVELGIKVGDSFEVDLSDTDPAEITEEELQALEGVREITDSDLDIIASYKGLYPDNDVFHLTTDGSVFLKNNLPEAKAHETHLTGNHKKVKSIAVE